jgi:flagellar FliJ protein
MAFKYKLETFLKLRQRLEEQAQYELAHEIFVLDNHKLFLGQLREGRQNLINVFEEKKRTTMTGLLYNFYSDSLQGQDRQIEFQINAIKAQEAIVAKFRSELEKRSQERRIVEKMKEKDYLEYVKEIVRKERVELDELAVLRFGRGQAL